ncbi:hypothetical protein M0802_001549 [Mischocyttarus mexicanus]|nr:hypothetical protein M0802_001549 [Mischocyttarus mexicanus]
MADNKEEISELIDKRGVTVGAISSSSSSSSSFSLMIVDHCSRCYRFCWLFVDDDNEDDVEEWNRNKNGGGLGQPEDDITAMHRYKAPICNERKYATTALVGYTYKIQHRFADAERNAVGCVLKRPRAKIAKLAACRPVAVAASAAASASAAAAAFSEFLLLLWVHSGTLPNLLKHAMRGLSRVSGLERSLAEDVEVGNVSTGDGREFKSEVEVEVDISRKSNSSNNNNNKRLGKMLTARSASLGVPRSLGPLEGSDHLFLLPERALIMDSSRLRQDLAGLDFNLRFNLLQTAPRGNVWLSPQLCSAQLSSAQLSSAQLSSAQLSFALLCSALLCSALLCSVLLCLRGCQEDINGIKITHANVSSVESLRYSIPATTSLPAATTATCLPA